jgi:hypothetical protein
MNTYKTGLKMLMKRRPVLVLSRKSSLPQQSNVGAPVQPRAPFMDVVTANSSPLHPQERHITRPFRPLPYNVRETMDKLLCEEMLDTNDILTIVSTLPLPPTWRVIDPLSTFKEMLHSTQATIDDSCRAIVNKIRVVFRSSTGLGYDTIDQLDARARVAVKGLRAQTGLNKLVYREVLYLHRVKVMSDLSNPRNLFKVAKEDPSGRATFAKLFFSIKPGSRCTVVMRGVCYPHPKRMGGVLVLASARRGAICLQRAVGL